VIAMSAVAHPSALRGPRNGGVAARRAVLRWAGRMFRREWRHQLLVLTLLTVAVAAAGPVKTIGAWPAVKTSLPGLPAPLGCSV